MMSLGTDVKEEEKKKFQIEEKDMEESEESEDKEDETAEVQPGLLEKLKLF